MTARQAVNTALDLLGYTDNNGNEQLTRRIMNKAVSVVNTVYSDLWGVVQGPAEFVPVKTLSEDIALAGRAAEAFPYGIAAFLAQSENDGDQQQLWMSVYNRRRAGLSRLTTVKDSVPRSCDL